MSLVTVTSSGRVYQRKFDHDEARAQYAAGGWSYDRLAEAYGVSARAIARVLNPQTARLMQAHNQKHMRSGLCEDCGGACSPAQYRAHNPNPLLCRACWATYKSEQNLLSRLNEAGDVRCSKCETYRPMVEFSSRGGFPKSWCRCCETAARADWRRRNPERSRALDRAAYERRSRKVAA